MFAAARGVLTLITCYIHYVISPIEIKEFEHYAKLWIPLVNKLGGNHHGYSLPSEGANNRALALFSFSSLAAYGAYRIKYFLEPECINAFKDTEDT